MRDIFIQVPFAVLEADMPAGHILGFQRLMARCFRDHSDVVRGTHRGIAKMLHVAKTSIIRMIPNWIKMGWVSQAEEGGEVILTLHCNRLESVPKRPTAMVAIAPPAIPDRDKSVPNQDKNGPDRDKSVPVLSVMHPVINDSTDTLKEDTDINITPIIFHTDPVPELTTELALQLVSHVLPVPPRTTGGPALERWLQKYEQPMDRILARQRPVTGPMAWDTIDLVTRYMAWQGSGWMQRIGALPTLEKVFSTWDMQMSQIQRLGWQPEERTPYPGVSCWDTNEETVPPTERAQPFAREYELESFGSALQASHPLELSIQDLPNGFLLLAQIGPDDFFAIDPEIWDNPSSSELDLIYQAIAYGSACACNEQRQAETIAI